MLMTSSNLYIWCLNEVDRNKNNFALGVNSDCDVALLSVPPQAKGKELCSPALFPFQGFSARRIIVMNAMHLEQAIKSVQESLQEAAQKYERIYLFVAPFWYKMAAMNAVIRSNLWHKVTAAEASTQRAHLDLISAIGAGLVLPPGLILGEEMSKSRGAKKAPEALSMYRKMPPALQYLKHSPLVRMTLEQEAIYASAATRGPGGQGVDWRSFHQTGKPANTDAEGWPTAAPGTSSETPDDTIEDLEGFKFD